MAEHRPADQKTSAGRVRAWVRHGAELTVVLGAVDRSGGWLAGRVGCSRQMIHALTNGQRLSCSTGLAERIESALGVPHSLLFRYGGDRSDAGQGGDGDGADPWDDPARRVLVIEDLANRHSPHDVRFLTMAGSAFELGSAASVVLVVAPGTQVSEAVKQVCVAVVEEGPSLQLRLDEAVRRTRRGKRHGALTRRP